MSIASVTIDCSSLSMSDIVISDDSDTYRLTPNGLGFVVDSVRTATAPDSININGSEIIAFTYEATALPLEFLILGDTTAEIADAKADLKEAFFRLDYAVTRTVDGVSVSYTGGPCALVPTNAAQRHEMVAAFIESYAVTIPFSSPDPIEVES